MPSFDRKLAVGNAYLKLFGLTKIPVLFFVKPSIVAWSNESITFKIPLIRRTKNHLGSMYFGVLAAGADLAGGFLAMDIIRESKEPVALIFKSMHAEFLKRAEGDVHFTCSQGNDIAALVKSAIETGERVELPVHVVATVPKLLGDEPIAKFTLVLSLKKKTRKAKTA